MKTILAILALTTAAFAQSPGISVVTVSGTTPTLTANAGYTVFNWTLAANVSSSTFSSPAIGAGALNLCENATGGFTVALPANFVGFAALASTAANYCQHYTWEYDGSNVTATSNPAAPLGADVNTAGQVTVTHLASGLPVNQGGTGQTSLTPALIVASGSSLALGTGAIAANTCASAVTATATGAATTDTVNWTPSADWSGITGYGKASTDGLIVYPFVTSGTVNFTVCNATGSSITPGSASVNWAVRR
jgi:hypothetical protein